MAPTTLYGPRTSRTRCAARLVTPDWNLRCTRAAGHQGEHRTVAIGDAPATFVSCPQCKATHTGGHECPPATMEASPDGW